MRIGALFSEDIAPLGVTLPMWRVMTELWHKGDHRLGELAERTSIDIPRCPGWSYRCRNRLIVRRRSGLDRRALSLTLTAKGLKLAEEIAPFALYYEKLAIGSLSRTDVTLLKSLLKKFSATWTRAVALVPCSLPRSPSCVPPGRSPDEPRSTQPTRESRSRRDYELGPL